MKKILLPTLALLFTASAFTLSAQTNRQIRHQYVMKNLKLDKATAARFSPVLMNYLTELKKAKSDYDDLKDKYRDMLKAGTLTNAQGEQLINAKLDSDAKELVVRKKYLAEFRRVIPMKKVYYAFDYANDSKSKIRGSKEDNDD